MRSSKSPNQGEGEEKALSKVKDLELFTHPAQRINREVHIGVCADDLENPVR